MPLKVVPFGADLNGTLMSVDKENGLTTKEVHNPLNPIFKAYPNAKRFELEMIEGLLGTFVKREIVEGPQGQKKTLFEINALGKVEMRPLFFL